MANNLLTGLSSYWKLDETSGSVLDSVGAVNGTLSGAFTQGVTGKISLALQGNNTGTAKVDFGANYAFADGTAFSLSGWFNWSGVKTGSSNNAVVFSRFNGYNINVANCSTDPASGIEIDIPGVAQAVRYVHSMASSTWYHVVATHDTSNNWTLYLNGASVAGPTAVTGMVADTNHPIFFAETNSQFNGIVDEWGLWTKVLSGTDVTNLYNSGSGLAFSSFDSGGTSTSSPGRGFLSMLGAGS